MRIHDIKVEDVISVYTGKPGCCCGCLGNHRYASAYQATASKNRGYPVTDDEVNDRQVKKVLTFLKANATEVTDHGNMFVHETDNRVHIVYLLKGDGELALEKCEVPAIDLENFASVVCDCITLSKEGDVNIRTASFDTLPGKWHDIMICPQETAFMSIVDFSKITDFFKDNDAENVSIQYHAGLKVGKTEKIHPHPVFRLMGTIKGELITLDLFPQSVDFDLYADRGEENDLP